MRSPISWTTKNGKMTSIEFRSMFNSVGNFSVIASTFLFILKVCGVAIGWKWVVLPLIASFLARKAIAWVMRFIVAPRVRARVAEQSARR